MSELRKLCVQFAGLSSCWGC